MDTKSVRFLVNSITRFVHLVSSQTLKPIPKHDDYKNIVSSLKLLKPLLDEASVCKISSNEILLKQCEQLDVAINEAREFTESLSPKMSRTTCILQSESLLMKIQSASLEVCYALERLLQEFPSMSCFSAVQHCIQELKCLELAIVSRHVEEALRFQRSGTVPSSDDLFKIAELLGLLSSHELLKENVALENVRMMAQANKNKGDLDHIHQILDLFGHIRSCMLELACLKSVKGVQVPPYFCCPLSLELMVDPVITASGQTYERAFIQKWLDHGLTICPKTRQVLSHTNLIPNYTVKALIENWCEKNNVRFSNTSDCDNIASVPLLNQEACQHFIHRDSFHSSRRNSTSGSSIDVGNGLEKPELYVCSRCNPDPPSSEQSYVHSRSESATSAISTEVSGITDTNEHVSEFSGEISSKQATSSPTEAVKSSPRLLELQVNRSNVDFKSPSTNENIDYPRTPVPAISNSGSTDSITTSHAEKLVEDLKSQSNQVQTMATAEIRHLTKHNMENRIIIGHGGAIPLLVSLLYSSVKETQEHAVTALLNLSINEENKSMIAEAGAIEPLIHVLKSGNDGAKENSAAALFSLSVLEEYKAKIGRSGAVKALVDLLGSGTLRGKKDAATALFNLSIFHENKARIIQAGAVKYLVEMMGPSSGMSEKAVALLANLSTVSEGQSAIARERGIPLLVELVETGSQREKENAASVLLQLCINSTKYCTLVLQEGAVPPLVALSQTGTLRGKEKAQQLLGHFRSQREGANGRKK